MGYDSHNWCQAHWPAEQDKRNELLMEIEALEGTQREAAVIKLERRESRRCSCFRHKDPDRTGANLGRPVNVGEHGFMSQHSRRVNATHYYVACPLCEPIINDAIAALRDEFRAGMIDADEAYQLTDACLQMECEHRLPLGPDGFQFPTTDNIPGDEDPEVYIPDNNKRIARLPSQERCIPVDLPSVEEVKLTLGSLDEALIARTIWAVELHVAHLVDKRSGGTDYSSVGAEFDVTRDLNNVSRSAFTVSLDEDDAVRVDPISEGEALAAEETELDARDQMRRMYGDQFAGFLHLEGGAADILLDADVAGARFRFDEVMRDRARTTEERYVLHMEQPLNVDESVGHSMGHIVDREMHTQTVWAHLNREEEDYIMLLPALKTRLSQVQAMEHFLPGLMSLEDEALHLLGWARSLMTDEVIRVCDPLMDPAWRHEAVHEPELLKLRLMQAPRPKAGRPRRVKGATSLTTPVEQPLTNEELAEMGYEAEAYDHDRHLDMIEVAS